MHFDLFGETFLLFDLDIDLQSITEVTILADWPHPPSTRAKPGGQHRIVNVLPDAVCFQDVHQLALVSEMGACG